MKYSLMALMFLSVKIGLGADEQTVAQPSLA